ncbi:MAG: cell division protein FtsZ [Candidatus Thorarchaeota archaeon]|nr:MAG: cell division protein FtsZ [Candidatus Thorarchaeota archaeon]RLI60180.1 MAG: cell division protein FtsZ [Candidatus Thorarchaeota archaeon]
MRSLIDSAREHSRVERSSSPSRDIGQARIVVVGCGGAGNNTVKRLMTIGVQGAECIAINTDRQHLAVTTAHRKLLIGERITRGLGAGGYPSVGRAAAEESAGQITELLRDADLVFIAAGMGGGTGTGSAPVVAEIAKKNDAIVVGVITMPFSLERTRIDKAKAGLARLQENVDTAVVIDNQKLMELVPDLPLEEAFGVADEVLANMVKGITETITMPSLINLDYADVRSIICNGGVALVGLGEATGSDRANDAIKNALNSPLLEVEWTGATGALIHITGGPDMSLAEANKVGEIVSEKMSSNANVIWGARVDPRLSGVLRVMLILTGVKSPQLLPRSKEESGISTATRRLAEFGILGTKADLASMKARGKAFGRAPENTRPTWEERLKPLERTLAGRRLSREEEPKKKRDLDELGLRRLL